ncbi:uncharacterized protein EDB91DRAFT_1256633 [Suillus paluster]|uniref:uncharacterized protein n=1 Tax=Suillus paluster TaxID=48578 RepID=UPI001B86769C|nr:uncharacterized protein EDB91DRAFT_1256633 [Suillus paluster]KAG1721167.1 hypothetical protein EDB91DRAFT_1256633 [Suillus paluster]
MATPISPRRTCAKNVSQHPGQVVLEGQRKRRTQAQIKEDKHHAREGQAVQEAAATQATGKTKPVKPHPKVVKKKPTAKGAATSESFQVPPVQAMVQGADDRTMLRRRCADGADIGNCGNGDVIGNLDAAKPKKNLKKVNNMLREAINAAKRQIVDGDLHKGKAQAASDKKGNPIVSVLMLTKSTLYFMTRTWALSNKKFNLLGEVKDWHNHVEPGTNTKNYPVASDVQSVSAENVLKLATSTFLSSQTAATTVSLAKDPPPTLYDLSEASASDEDDEFEEYLSAPAGSGKVKAVMQSVVGIVEPYSDEEVPVSIPFNLLPFSQQAEIVTYALEQSTRTISVTKWTIKEIDKEYDMDSDADLMILDSEDVEVISPNSEVEEVPKPMHTTTKTSVTVSENPNPPKKAKVESMSSPSILVSPKPNLMSADTAIKPKPGYQWRNTDLPPIMLENSTWHRNFIPTVFLWAGPQPNFWTIETEHLLPALQAIFEVAYPGVMHNVQPKGPIIGLSEEDDDFDFEQALVANLLEQYAFLYENPDTCDPDEIYRSAFMLEMIETAHLNATAGSLNVPALNTHDLQSKGMETIIAACAATLKHAFSFIGKPKEDEDAQTTTSSTKGGSMTRKLNKATGKESTAAKAFSEINCGATMAEYYESIMRHGPQYTVDTIDLVHWHQEAAQVKNAPIETMKPRDGCALLSMMHQAC